MNAKWLEKRLAKCPPASWREETKVLADFSRIRAIVDRKREGRRGLREAQARLAPRVIDYHREAKPVTTRGTGAQDGGDDGDRDRENTTHRGYFSTRRLFTGQGILRAVQGIPLDIMAHDSGWQGASFGPGRPLAALSPL